MTSKSSESVTKFFESLNSLIGKGNVEEVIEKLNSHDGQYILTKERIKFNNYNFMQILIYFGIEGLDTESECKPKFDGYTRLSIKAKQAKITELKNIFNFLKDNKLFERLREDILNKGTTTHEETPISLLKICGGITIPSRQDDGVTNVETLPQVTETKRPNNQTTFFESIDDNSVHSSNTLNPPVEFQPSTNEANEECKDLETLLNTAQTKMDDKCKDQKRRFGFGFGIFKQGPNEECKVSKESFNKAQEEYYKCNKFLGEKLEKVSKTPRLDRFKETMSGLTKRFTFRNWRKKSSGGYKTKKHKKQKPHKKKSRRNIKVNIKNKQKHRKTMKK